MKWESFQRPSTLAMEKSSLPYLTQTHDNIFIPRRVPWALSFLTFMPSFQKHGRPALQKQHKNRASERAWCWMKYTLVLFELLVSGCAFQSLRESIITFSLPSVQYHLYNVRLFGWSGRFVFLFVVQQALIPRSAERVLKIKKITCDLQRRKQASQDIWNCVCYAR